jgi:outer membrane lipoprotein LolB
MLLNMLRRVMAGCCFLVLSACVTRAPAPREPAPLSPSAWAMRAQVLQHANSWTMQGRAAVAAGTQGWQATLDWRQRDSSSELHLAGPLGIGAQVITSTPAGISVNGAAPGASALAQLQERLGFALPVDDLRFWLLGVPNPGGTFELTRNDQGRALHLTQGDWSIDYDRYAAYGGDELPGRIVLTRGDIRVRIIVDHWDLRR